jgi:uroporphyrinogen decarboxylase
MTPRERVMCTLAHEVPDQVPAYVRNVEDWERHAAYFGVNTLGELMDRLGNIIVSFVPAYKGCDGRVLPKPYSPALPAVWGIPEEFAGTYSHAMPRPLSDAATVADVDAYAWPCAGESAWDLNQMHRRLLRDEAHARMSPSWTPLFSRLCELFGMEQAMVNLLTNRRVIEAALAHLDEFYTGFFSHMLDQCGDQLEVFGLGDDFACNRGLLIRPEVWRQLFKPLYAKWLGMAKTKGLLTLMHCCGLIQEVLPDLIDSGLDAWQTVQTHLPGQDAACIKAEFGQHLAFVGAVDTTNVLGTEDRDRVRAHVREQIQALGAGGGYVCAPDHTIMAEVPSENVAAMYETVAAFREPGYTMHRPSPALDAKTHATSADAREHTMRRLAGT